ncbi:uncharacterized protein LOC117779794 [Drosophila innubila]|uniref:uncharacterized protein LOC117779794 n=1 Tax=Drosophila innubila TaxID=198719 RepID=UPI00148CB88A|nr:uncharacterized protein LOC117779794 [Drosophila innubila]
MPLGCACCWLLLLMHLCLAIGSSHPKGKRHVVVAHDGFHNINKEPKYRNWRTRQEQHAKHHNPITQTIINN